MEHKIDIDAYDIEALTQAKVLVVGDLMLDEFTYGDVSRISPEAPIPVMRETSIKRMLGGAGNVYHNLQSIGARADIVSVIGDDAAGRFLHDLIDVSTSEFDDAFLLKDINRITTVKKRFIANDQQMLRVDHEVVADISDTCDQALIALLQEQVANYDVVILSDYGKGVLTAKNTPKIIKLARDHNVFVMVDPKGMSYQKYAGANLVKPNRHELALATDMPVESLDQVKKAAHWLQEQFAIESIVVTLSEDGLLALGHGDHEFYFSSNAQEITDVSGAGDTVIAMLAASMGAKLDLEKALFIANQSAAAVVAKVGTATVTREEIWRHIRSDMIISSQKGLYAYHEISDKVAQWQKRNLKVGFTNGCFDLIHPGHVNLLNKGKARCDRLVVAINSDASVRELKGLARPIQDEIARATVLLSMQAVDAVVIFHEATPAQVIEYVQPDLLFKGREYNADTIVGAEFVQARGGEIEIIDSETNHHTSSLITKLA